MGYRIVEGVWFSDYGNIGFICVYAWTVVWVRIKFVLYYSFEIRLLFVKIVICYLFF